MVTEVIDWLELASVLGPDRTYRQADARTVELCKYMENCWLSEQVLFVNEFARIARVMKIDYWELREMWVIRCFGNSCGVELCWL